MFARSTEYAIRAMTFLALQPAGRLTGAREIAMAEQIPMQFLWKILQALGRGRLVRSFKGPGGGYELAKAASAISVEDIVVATDDKDFTGACVLGLAVCNDEKPCPLHNTWKEIRERLTIMLEQTTLADLARTSFLNNRNLQSPIRARHDSGLKTPPNSTGDKSRE